MRYSVASYSFHRLLESGKQDMFKYILDCKELGCAQLDPWNGHLVPLIEGNNAMRAGPDALRPTFSDAELDYTDQVKVAADDARLPFGCLAVDGAHIYEPTPEQRHLNRAAAYRWLDVARRLGAAQIRIDSGGTADLPDEQFQLIVEGYNDVIARARESNIEVVIENHWGASNVPENLVRMLDAVGGLGLLFDTNNWAAGTRDKGWEMCARYARSVHIKPFEFDENGNDPTVDLPRAIHMLVDAGYDGCWGIESSPRNGDEYGAVRKSIALIQRALDGRA